MARHLDKILVAGQMTILTKEYGQMYVSSANQNVDLHVWNGEEYAPTKVRMDTDTRTEEYVINFNSRIYLKVGPGFNFLVSDEISDETIIKRAKDLQFGDYVIPFRAPDLDHESKVIPNKFTKHSTFRVCKVEDLKSKSEMYYLDYTHSDRFLIQGLITGIS